MMYPAKALQTAVFAIAGATYVPANIRNTDITVALKFGRYLINDAGAEYVRYDRDEAIATIKQLLSSNEELTPADAGWDSNE
jgi:hypothetical protein